jgi:hypothetical protein
MTDQTTPFFQPGHTYATPLRPGGPDRFRFRCDAVTTDPSTGEQRAVGEHGKLRTADGAWLWVPNERTRDDWSGGAWTDVTAAPKEK